MRAGGERQGELGFLPVKSRFMPAAFVQHYKKFLDIAP